MAHSKYSFLKQWFTVTWDDNKLTDMFYSCTNNHYLQGWMEERGYTAFENVLKQDDLDYLIFCLNEPWKATDDDFNKYFPEKYIKDYTLWNMDKGEYWDDAWVYRRYSRDQMSKMFDELWEVQENLDAGKTGVIKYNIYYHH